MSATLDGLSYDDNGTFDASGNYLQKAVLGPAKSDIVGYQAAGVPGQGTTNFGYISQLVVCEVMYVDSDVDTVFGNAQADNLQLGDHVFDATVNGVELHACRLLDFRTAPEGARNTGLPSGLCSLKATITFEALRPE